jgi:hypothetical protein
VSIEIVVPAMLICVSGRIHHGEWHEPLLACGGQDQYLNNGLLNGLAEFAWLHPVHKLS